MLRLLRISIFGPIHANTVAFGREQARTGFTLIIVGLSRRLSGETGSKRRRCARRNIPRAAIAQQMYGGEVFTRQSWTPSTRPSVNAHVAVLAPTGGFHVVHEERGPRRKVGPFGPSDPPC